MHLSHSTTVLAISLLFACACSSAQERSVASSQSYRIHVRKEIKFGAIQPAQLAEVNAPLAQQENAAADSLVFMAETTSGMTIQFETESAESPPLKLTLGGGEEGHWWANAVADETGSKGKSVAEATSVQASTLRPGWSTLTLDIIEPQTGVDETVTTIMVTIVAH